MTKESLVELADVKSRQRAILFGFAGLAFLVIQIVVHPVFANEAYTVGWRKYSWVFTEVLLLLCLGGGGGIFNPRALRELIDDEVARSNYRASCTLGFWTAMWCALALYVLPPFQDFTGLQSTYVVVTLSTVVAFLKFSWLEYRAHAGK